MADNEQDGTPDEAILQTQDVANDVEQAEGAVASTEPEAALAQPTPADEAETVQDAERPAAPSEDAEADAPTLLERLKDAAGSVVEGAQHAAEVVAENVSHAAEVVTEKAKDVAGSVAESARHAAEVVAENVGHAAEVVTEKAKDVAESVSERARGAATAATVSAANVAERAADAVLDRMGPDGDGGDSPLVGYTGRETHETIKLSDLDARETTDAMRKQRAQLTDLLTETFTRIPQNDIVKGRIVTVTDKDVVIDIGGKSDGIIARSEWSGSEVAPGQEVEVFVERLENRQGQLQLSKEKADATLRWRRIQSAFETEEVLEGEIIRRIKGGMIVQLFDNIEAFLPGSQIDVRPVRDFDAYLGPPHGVQDRQAQRDEPEHRRLPQGPHRAGPGLAAPERSSRRWSPGQVLEGTVKNITDFGVFVDLGGVDGLLHITDLSWGRVQHPSEVVAIDEKLNVVVLDYDKRPAAHLAGPQAAPEPPVGDHPREVRRRAGGEGKVVSITDYGAFVELEKGIEGLVHISEMSWTEHVKHPSQVVSAGQNVEVKILGIDDDNKKISLGMKQLQEDPWAGIAARFPIGTTCTGKVRNITAFGVFVEIEPGIDGLVHISDLSWTKKVRHPGEVVKKGQELDVKVVGIDEKNRRISLCHKEVQTDPWHDLPRSLLRGQRDTGQGRARARQGPRRGARQRVEGFVPAGELRRAATRRTTTARAQSSKSCG